MDKARPKQPFPQPDGKWRIVNVGKTTARVDGHQSALRETGELSIFVDRGLKRGKLDEIVLTREQAIEHASKILVAALRLPQ